MSQNRHIPIFISLKFSSLYYSRVFVKNINHKHQIK
nr:MAG TPA: hypothetical protein [Caudoviricetes sp.]